MRRQPLALALLLLAPAVPAAAGDPPPPAGPPAPAPSADDPFVAGERAVDEAMRWIAKGETPVAGLQTLHTDLDYAYDDGSTQDQRRMELWFRNPDAFRANFEWGGRASTFLLVGENAAMIRDRIRYTDLSNSPTMNRLVPMLRNYRAVLHEVGRMLAPKSPGARFRLEGVVPNAAATGGQWFKVVRTAPREPMMTYLFGSAPRREGGGLRAIAPDRLVIHGEPGSSYAGDEYRLEEWARSDAAAQREAVRYPKRVRLYAIGIDPENKPTMHATIHFLELNQPVDPNLFYLPWATK